jgi:hypothetical protein
MANHDFSLFLGVDVPGDVVAPASGAVGADAEEKRGMERVWCAHTQRKRAAGGAGTLV